MGKNNNTMSITLKVSINSQIRRFTLPTPSNWEEFQTKLASLLEVKSPLTVKYTDEEGDLITISNQMDLEEGLRVYKSSGSSVWKLTINSSSDTSPTPSKTDSKKKEETKP